MAPWGASVRLDDAPIWKIAVFGDPLITSGETFKSAPAALVLDPQTGLLRGAEDVGQGLTELARAGKFVEVVRDLNLLGRDAKISELVVALVRQSPDKVTPELAAESILPIFRAGIETGVREVFEVARRLPPESADHPFVAGPVRDALWLAAYGNFERPDEDMIQVLRYHIRPEMAERDATELGQAWARRHGKAPAVLMLRELKTGPRALPPEAVDQAITAVNLMRQAR